MRKILNKILVGAPVAETAEILQAYLRCMELLTVPEDTEVSFFFIDNCTDDRSSNLLREFVDRSDRPAKIEPFEKFPLHRGEGVHDWTPDRIMNMIRMRNRFLEIPRNGIEDDPTTSAFSNLTHVFLVDSDLLFAPDTLIKLLTHRVQVVSGVFWTRWEPHFQPLPNVWLDGHYRMTEPFIEALKVPGIYPVGGLGACTLIEKRVVDQGVTYDPIYNLGPKFSGEDRYFCIRAAVAGIQLYADSSVEVLHVYRDSELNELKKHAYWLT